MRVSPSRITRKAALLALATPHDAYAIFRGSGEGDGLLFVAIAAVVAVYFAIAKVHAKFPNFFPSIVALIMCMVVASAVAEIPYYLRIIDAYEKRDIVLVGGVALWAVVLYKLL